MGAKRPASVIRYSVIAVAAALVLAAVCMAFSAPRKSSDYSPADYEVTSLDMRVAVGKDHTYEVEEFISVDIPEDLQQIEFAVPAGSYKMKDLTVENVKTRVFRRDYGKCVVISDPDLLTAGHHRYKLRFRLLEKADQNQGKDVFSFDILPQGWKQPVYKVHALTWFPYGFPLDDIHCFSDGDPDVRLTVKIEKQSRSYTLGGRRIPADYDLRLEADLPDGYWE